MKITSHRNLPTGHIIAITDDDQYPVFCRYPTGVWQYMDCITPTPPSVLKNNQIEDLYEHYLRRSCLTTTDQFYDAYHAFWGYVKDHPDIHPSGYRKDAFGHVWLWYEPCVKSVSVATLKNLSVAFMGAWIYAMDVPGYSVAGLAKISHHEKYDESAFMYVHQCLEHYLKEN